MSLRQGIRIRKLCLFSMPVNTALYHYYVSSTDQNIHVLIRYCHFSKKYMTAVSETYNFVDLLICYKAALPSHPDPKKHKDAFVHNGIYFVCLIQSDDFFSDFYGCIVILFYNQKLHIFMHQTNICVCIINLTVFTFRIRFCRKTFFFIQ